MDEYLTKMRAKPAHHKKYFALGVSGCVTSIIFLVWSFVNFGGAATVVAENIPDEKVRAVSPFQNVGNSLSSTWSALGDQYKNTTSDLDSADFNSKYENMRDDALNN